MLLVNCFDPKPSSILQGFKFYNGNLAKGEMIAMYKAALDHLFRLNTVNKTYS